MSANYFDEPVAATYDDDVSAMFAPAAVEPAVEFLAGLAGDRPALELAVGTGRLALPLSRRGVRVCGIDLSAAMLERLRAKPGADAIEVTVGDMTSSRVEGRFGLVYLVFNTISNLLSQDSQVACFRNAAAHLEPGGFFVVELTVPALQRLPPGETHHVFRHDDHHLGFDEYDVVTQQMWSHHHSFDGSAYRSVSVPFRYAWPAELDLMARLAGMDLVERWADWDRGPFTAESPSHVSVWQLPS
ncbi:class I SAM-dependent DNA methyltransferase [Nocardioides pocheonensis]|uniref:Class I SAM-dependent methyltransferase n=1 Tax=Nocardioides pocheonensis TaxID=661485 RepID=A0A3N0GSD5_9ACTN|nr:class I SAM-dependent methyltransferase [Nocardioides pocheonensis]RNM15311.1 class I SAM-dependent methyltransferase [Nocardioides pocheonensis]